MYATVIRRSVRFSIVFIASLLLCTSSSCASFVLGGATTKVYGFGTGYRDKGSSSQNGAYVFDSDGFSSDSPGTPTARFEAEAMSNSTFIRARSFTSYRSSEPSWSAGTWAYETHSSASFFDEIKIGTLSPEQNFFATTSVQAINLNFRVHGTLAVGIDVSPGGQTFGAYSQAQAGFGVMDLALNRSLGSDSWRLYSSHGSPAVMTTPIDAMVRARLTLNNGTGRYMASVNTMTYSNDGFAYANFFETISLASITLDDGTTPESQGYVLQFGSGRMSPNLAAVPEPATMALWGIGAAGVAAMRFRRTRKTQSKSLSASA